MAKGRKFRDVKSECRELVKSYREEYNDARSRPEFHIGCYSAFGRRGTIQLMWRPKGQEEPIFSEAISYESIAELAFIIEYLGKAWETTNP